MEGLGRSVMGECADAIFPALQTLPILAKLSFIIKGGLSHLETERACRFRFR